MDEARLRSLYEQYGYQVHARCRYLLQDDDEAADAVQEVFLRAEQSFASYAGRSGLARWLDRIALHHCLNRLRAQRVRRGRGVVGATLLDAEEAGQQRPQVEVRELVRSLLDRFDVETQTLAVLYFVDELSQEEVAAEVGLSVPTVRKRLRGFVEQARRRLAS
ncbi:MAG: sigma-70 family RNA polymerase sigma factor [Myxococcota bacterium]|nr:sigma-70 family RNA polymerase sigma factor [Myxococcota bacterium]